MQSYGIAIIGAGKMGITHCGAFMEQEAARVVAACDLDVTKLRVLANGPWPEIEYYEDEFERLYEVEILSTNICEVLSREDIDAVVVSTPNVSHYDIAKAALQSGKHVLVEKPMTVAYRQAKELTEIAQRRSLIFSVGQCWRFHPEVDYVRNIVVSGLIGEVVKVKGYGIHESWMPESSWFVKKALAGGGALIDMGIHPIDTMRYVLDAPRFSHVHAEMLTSYGTYDVEDIGTAVLTLDSGGFAQIEFGWANVHADGVESSLQIFGTKGYVRLFPTTVKYDVSGARGEFFPSEHHRYLTKELYASQASHFVDCLQNNVQGINSAEDNLETMKLIDALYRSSNEKRLVRLGEYVNGGEV